MICERSESDKRAQPGFIFSKLETKSPNTTNLSLDYNFSVNIKSDFTQKILKELGFTWKKIDNKYLSIIIKYMKDVNFI